MTGAEIFAEVIFGHTVFRRDRDAWDLIDGNGLVAAVLCPRTHHLTISLPDERMQPKPAGRRMPYGERKAHEIRGTAEDIAHAKEILAELARPSR